MTSDSLDSHRKHRRTPSDDDSPEYSKRHKHRHHKRHRHHHRPKSSKHGDFKKDAIDVENRDEALEEASRRPPLVDYDDMEEGEIVDDEALADAVKKVESDAESGEFKAADDSYMSVEDGLENNGKNSSKYLKSPRSDQSVESKEDEFSVLEKKENGDLGRRSSNGESRSHSRRKSLVKESSMEKDRRMIEGKEKVLDSMEVDIDDLGGRSHSYSRMDHHEALYRTSSQGRYHLEIINDKSRSESPDQTRERERSQSIVHERYSKTRHREERDERLYSNSNVDDEKYIVNGGGKKTKEKGERSSSYHRSSVCEGKHEDSDSREIEKEERIYWDKKRVVQEPSKERRGRDWGIERDGIRRRDHDWEKDSLRDKERSRETKNDIDWNRDRGRSREREREKERRDCGRSRDWDFVRERRRELRDGSISMYKDRDAEREEDKLRDRSRKLDMDGGKDRYSDRHRHKEKARDDDSDRSSRYHKYDDRDDAHPDRRRGYHEAEDFKDRKSKHNTEKDQASKVESRKENVDDLNGEDEKDYEDTLELKPVEHEEDDIERIKEESRKRREAILQKYKVKPSQQQQAVPQVLKVSYEEEEPAKQPSQKLASESVVPEENNGVKVGNQDASVVKTSSNLWTSALSKDSTATERITDMLGEGSPKSERSNDMFCDDIFGDSPAEIRKMGKGDGLPLERSGLHDNWDDPEGYYSFRFGEILDSRYEITAAHGKGVFSTVVRAKDLKAGSVDPEEVAIKIIRNNETMLKAGTEELVILKKLVGADPDDRRHCVRYLSNFKYRNHLCIVFESLHMNLREVLKKFGRNIGLKLTAVRTYAKQLFIALKHLRNCGVLHCDIKPDNMLVNDSKNVLKLCDFGNAMFAGKNEITPYLVSRFYRAPEIILGLPYDHPMDIWSVGCCLYELYTGKVLFPGPSNNDMLRLHMELKGPFPKKMLRKGAFIEQHFDQDLNFLATEEDPVTKKSIRKLIVNIKPKDVGNIIRGSPGEDPKMLANFKDLLDKIFVLDPDKRLTVSQALNHPFITGK